MSPCLKNFLFTPGLFVAFIFLFASCDKHYVNYLQEKTVIPPSPPLSTVHDINHYADSVNSLLPVSRISKSLVYYLGDYSFQITKYVKDNKPFLYIEDGNGSEHGNSRKYYYIKDNAINLIIESTSTLHDSTPFKTIKSYLKGDSVFYTHEKKGGDKSLTKNRPFTEIQTKPFTTITLIGFFEEALNQRGKFDLVFQGIADCAKAKYLIFSKDEFNAYRTPIKVELEDEFVHELSTNPLRYRGEEMDIDWHLDNNNEAIYKNGRLKTKD